MHGIEDNEDYEIHHIVPVAYAIAVLGMADWEINNFTNLIPLPKEEHHSLLGHVPKDWMETEQPYHNNQNDDIYRERALEAVRAWLKEQEGV